LPRHAIIDIFRCIFAIIDAIGIYYIIFIIDFIITPLFCHRHYFRHFSLSFLSLLSPLFSFHCITPLLSWRFRQRCIITPAAIAIAAIDSAFTY
jgi:hypothetical protein